METTLDDGGTVHDGTSLRGKMGKTFREGQKRNYAYTLTAMHFPAFLV